MSTDVSVYEDVVVDVSAQIDVTINWRHFRTGDKIHGMKFIGQFPSECNLPSDTGKSCLIAFVSDAENEWYVTEQKAHQPFGPETSPYYTIEWQEYKGLGMSGYLGQFDSFEQANFAANQNIAIKHNHIIFDNNVPFNAISQGERRINYYRGAMLAYVQEQLYTIYSFSREIRESE